MYLILILSVLLIVDQHEVSAGSNMKCGHVQEWKDGYSKVNLYPEVSCRHVAFSFYEFNIVKLLSLT